MIKIIKMMMITMGEGVDVLDVYQSIRANMESFWDHFEIISGVIYGIFGGNLDCQGSSWNHMKHLRVILGSYDGNLVIILRHFRIIWGRIGII
eukprot:931535-Karenia_brevis.AAC.1